METIISINMTTVIDSLTRYYGIDWLLFFLIAIYLWMVGKHWRNGWAVGIAGSCCAVYLGYLCGSIGMVVMNIVFGAMQGYNFFKWKSDN